MTRQQVRNELKAFGQGAVKQLFGRYPKPAVSDQRQLRLAVVFYHLPEREQCEDCLRWFPIEELIRDEDGRYFCRQCASIIGRW